MSDPVFDEDGALVGTQVHDHVDVVVERVNKICRLLGSNLPADQLTFAALPVAFARMMIHANVPRDAYIEILTSAYDTGIEAKQKTGSPL